MIYGYQEYKWIHKIEKVCDIFMTTRKINSQRKRKKLAKRINNLEN